MGKGNEAALQRGPIVYCVEQQDSPVPVPNRYLPEDAKFTPQYRPDFLGGVAVLNESLAQSAIELVDSSWKFDTKLVPVTFIPYGFWNNRKPDRMWMWLQAQGPSIKKLDDLSIHPPG